MDLNLRTMFFKKDESKERISEIVDIIRGVNTKLTEFNIRLDNLEQNFKSLRGRINRIHYGTDKLDNEEEDQEEEKPKQKKKNESVKYNDGFDDLRSLRKDLGL